jgi:hypothetical protein
MKKHRRKSILSCILLEKPRITLLVQLVVIVFKYVVKSLGFPKCERLDKGGAEGPPTSLSCILLEKPRITLLVQLVVIVFKYVVKSLGFPKCERFRGIWYSVKQIILFISYIAKMAFFRFLVFILLVEVLTKVLGRGFDQGFG